MVLFILDPPPLGCNSTITVQKQVSHSSPKLEMECGRSPPKSRRLGSPDFYESLREKPDGPKDVSESGGWAIWGIQRMKDVGRQDFQC